MNNAELIAGLRYCGGKEKHCKLCPSYDTCHAEVDGLKQILLAAADLIEAQAKLIAELEVQMPKEGEWKTNIRWDYQQPTQSTTTNVGTTFLCRSTGKPCPNATEYGYCKQTVCTIDSVRR